MFSTKAANATAPNAEFLAHVSWIVSHTQTNQKIEHGEEIGKVYFHSSWTFLFCIRKRCLIFNFWLVGKHLQRNKQRLSFFQTCMICPRKKAPHPSKKHLPKHTLGFKTSNLHLPDLQMWRIFHMICLISHFQSFTHGSRIDLRRFDQIRAPDLFRVVGWLSLARCTNTADTPREN